MLNRLVDQFIGASVSSLRAPAEQGENGEEEDREEGKRRGD
jgi:hypothetical protein